MRPPERRRDRRRLPGHRQDQLVPHPGPADHLLGQRERPKDDFPNGLPGTLGNAQLGYNRKDTVQNFVLNYDWNINPSLFLSAKLGTTQYKTTNNPTDTTTVRVTDYRGKLDGPRRDQRRSPMPAAAWPSVAAAPATT